MAHLDWRADSPKSPPRDWKPLYSPSALQRRDRYDDPYQRRPRDQQFGSVKNLLDAEISSGTDAFRGRGLGLDPYRQSGQSPLASHRGEANSLPRDVALLSPSELRDMIRAELAANMEQMSNDGDPSKSGALSELRSDLTKLEKEFNVRLRHLETRLQGQLKEVMAASKQEAMMQQEVSRSLAKQLGTVKEGTAAMRAIVETQANAHKDMQDGVFRIETDVRRLEKFTSAGEAASEYNAMQKRVEEVERWCREVGGGAGYETLEMRLNAEKDARQMQARHLVMEFQRGLVLESEDRKRFCARACGELQLQFETLGHLVGDMGKVGAKHLVERVDRLDRQMAKLSTVNVNIQDLAPVRRPGTTVAEAAKLMLQKNAEEVSKRISMVDFAQNNSRGDVQFQNLLKQFSSFQQEVKVEREKQEKELRDAIRRVEKNVREKDGLGGADAAVGAKIAPQTRLGGAADKPSALKNPQRSMAPGRPKASPKQLELSKAPPPPGGFAQSKAPGLAGPGPSPAIGVQGPQPQGPQASPRGPQGPAAIQVLPPGKADETPRTQATDTPRSNASGEDAAGGRGTPGSAGSRDDEGGKKKGTPARPSGKDPAEPKKGGRPAGKDAAEPKKATPPTPPAAKGTPPTPEAKAKPKGEAKAASPKAKGKAGQPRKPAK